MKKIVFFLLLVGAISMMVQTASAGARSAPIVPTVPSDPQPLSSQG